VVRLDENIEYLKHLPKDWHQQYDSVHRVAIVLDDIGVFADKKQVISFFEKPWTWQNEIDTLVREYE